jgi:uncharacterized protein (DUF2235 family)
VYKGLVFFKGSIERSAAMGKNIVICCDGTANEFAKNNTNVVKLYYTLEQDATKQVTYYHPGLGTMEPDGALTTVARKFTKLLGMAVGFRNRLAPVRATIGNGL